MGTRNEMQRAAVRIRAVLALLACLIAFSAAAASPEQLFTRLRGSVVTVHVKEYVVQGAEQLQVALVPSKGAGVLLSADGKVLTAAHLVQTADEIAVEFDDGTRIAARVYASEPAADIALLQLEEPPRAVSPVKLADSDQVRTGQSVVAIGAPFGLAGMQSVGYVAGRHRPETPFGRMEQLEMFVIDAHVERGSSGGGVFDGEGRLIGLVTSVQFGAGRSFGLGFAIASNTIRALLVERRSFWTGVGGFLVSGRLAQMLNVPQHCGLLVQRIARDSPAVRIGLRGGTMVASIGDERFVIGGDIVLKLQGIALDGPAQYARAQRELAQLADGDVLRATVLRDGRVIELEGPVRR